MEEKVLRIKQFYNLIKNDPSNDYFLFPFADLVIELLLDFKLISDKGMSILSRDINLDFQNLNNNIEVDKSRLWVCLYFLCVYHLSKCFVSFVEVLMNATEGKYEELRIQLDQEDDEILINLVDVKERVFTFIDISKNMLEIETNKLTDDIQAKTFDEHKRKCIDKPNYFKEEDIYIPADMPEGVQVNG
jgi:hypothetical protein